MVVSKRARAAIIGALMGAALCPMAIYLFGLSDGGYHPGAFVETCIVLFWFSISLPGVVLENRGHLTIGFTCLFWATLGACTGSRLQAWRARPTSPS